VSKNTYRTILLVEDEVQISVGEKRVLEGFGYRVLTAHSGLEAVQTFEVEDEIDLVLMDMDLGKGMDGSEAARRIQEKRAVPLVFLSSRLEPEVVERTERIASYGYVVKNSGATVLNTAIKMAFKLFDEQQNLKRSEERYRCLVETTDTGYVILDEEGRVLDANREYLRLTGRAGLDEILGKSVLDWTADEEKEENARAVAACMKDGLIRNFEITYVDKSGRRTPIGINASRLEAEGRRRILTLCRDITEGRRAEATARSLTRMYSLTSSVNKAIVRCRDPAELLQSVCDSAIENGGFRLVWIGKVDALARTVEVAASRGASADYLSALDIDLTDMYRSGGPTGKSVLSGSRAICNDILADDGMKPWRRAALQNGFRSSAAFPVFVGGEIWGALNIYASETGFFSGEEAELLDGLALDLGFAIEAQRNEAKRRQAEERTRRQLMEEELILKEVHHRIKNNIASIGSLLAMQLRSISSPEIASVIQDIIGRINSMRFLYDKLILSEKVEDIPVRGYVENLVNAIAELFPNSDGIATLVDIEDFTLDSRHMFYLGIFINELMTNIYKYAFAEGSEGSVSLDLRMSGRRVTLAIKDDGRGLPAGFDIDRSTGFGITLVRLLCEQLGGTFAVTSSGGTESVLEFDV
jgi:PAS domain S-box-containing protein